MEKSSRKKSPILQETSTQAGEQSSTKRPPQEEGVRLEATEKSSRKGPPNERLKEAQEVKEAEKRLRKPLALVLQAAQKSSSQVQETSKQSSQRRRFITEEDDEMFSCNVTLSLQSWSTDLKHTSKTRQRNLQYCRKLLPRQGSKAQRSDRCRKKE